MRDSQDRYTVTGVATNVLTPTVSVRSQTDWTVYHMQLIPSSWYQKDARDRLVLRDTQGPDEDMVAELEAHAGRDDIQHCPEETALMLGIDEHRSIPVDRVEINQACGEPGLPAHLDSPSFKDAARLLKTVPNLLGECSCAPNED